jgi:hypothetical protein
LAAHFTEPALFRRSLLPSDIEKLALLLKWRVKDRMNVELPGA